MRAFGSARAAQLRVAGRREKRHGALHFDVGIALHFGNAAARWISPHASLTYAVNSAKVCSCRSRSKAASLSMISADSEPSPRIATCGEPTPQWAEPWDKDRGELPGDSLRALPWLTKGPGGR